MIHPSCFRNFMLLNNVMKITLSRVEVESVV